MVDAVMDKTAHVQLVAAAQTIGINNLSGMIFFLMTGSNVSDLAFLHNGIDPSVAFQNAEDNHFSCRTATTSAFTPSAEIAFVRLDRALKNLIGSQGQMMVDNRADFTVEQCCRIGMDTQNIGGRTGGNFEYKKTDQFFLYFFL
ncbi:hypothetical protein NM69100_1878 [Neisseria meningitidis 69100]|nr:hypothetical protein NM69100_1878 [Neisseria meningitidis 69100]